MWSKILSVSIILILGCVSCDTGCSIPQQEEARKSVSIAFREWQDALNYMDEKIIGEAYGHLTQCTAEALACIHIDSTSINLLDSINRVFIDPVLESAAISSAEKMIEELEAKFVFRPQL